MQPISEESLNLLSLFEQELCIVHGDMAIARALRRYAAGEHAEPLSIPKEVETTGKRIKEEVDAEPYKEPDYRSKDYIGFAGEWAKGTRKDIADGKVCKDYPQGCDDCKDHTARTRSSPSSSDSSSETPPEVLAQEFWEKADKMTPEEKKRAHQTQWASAMYDFLKEREEKEKYRKK